MKVAAIQMKVSSSKADNLKRMLHFIKEAKDADVVCFPELCLQCEIDDVLPVKDDLAVLCNAAAECDINIIFGSYIRYKAQIRNRIFVVDRKGVIIHRYDKRHPFMSEQDRVTRGHVNRLFELDSVPCAVINCWDYAFPEYGRSLARKGAKVVFCPSYLMSHPRTSEVLSRIPQVRAFDFMSYFVMVDAFADDSFRRTRICHPLRELASLEAKEGMISADLDVGEVESLRSDFNNF